MASLQTRKDALRRCTWKNDNLIGEFPLEISGLTRLKELNLRLNVISGEIPSELEDLTNLEVLSLSINRLSGELPSMLGELSKSEGPGPLLEPI